MTKEERSAYMARYRKEHREQINASARYRYRKNREKYLACQKAYYERRTAKNSKWISVDERLPIGADGKEIAENVIAYTVDGEVATGWVMDDVWWLLYGNNDHHMKHGRGYVTHWMPLPEPPKMKGGAE